MFNNKNLDIKRGIILPKENSEKLAEFFGILAGDGHVDFRDNKKYIIQISGHKLDDELYHTNYVFLLFKELFGLNPKIYLHSRQNTRWTYANSRTIVDFIKSSGFYKYRGKIKIPDWIFKDNKYFDKFLRGFMDTDGSIAIKKRYRKIPYYPVLSLSNKSYELMEKVANHLRSLGLTFWFGLSKNYDKRSKTYSNVYKIEMSGFNNLKKWNRLLSFSNPKHINKILKLNGSRGI